MAEVFLSGFLPIVLEKLGSPVINKFGLLTGVKKEVQKLHTKFLAIEAVLQEAEDQQLTNKRMRVWLDNLKDVAYDVDDILDEFATEDLRGKIEIRNRMTSKVFNFFTPSNPFIFYFKMAHKVREVVKRLDEIAKEKCDFNLSQKVVDRHIVTEERIPTHSFIHESEVYGRNEDKERLTQLLFDAGDENENDVSVIPIFGMGGLGKTTLAKFVYNDENVNRYFDKRMWVCVSENFNMREIMKAIIELESEDKCHLSNMELLQSHLRRSLYGKKYLLVLDDVWDENQENWVQLKTLLKGGVRGSKVIVTTRSENVMSIMGTVEKYYLNELPEEDCWSLMKRRAFPKRDEASYPNLLPIGMEIVKKAGGVPLAAEALGGMLHDKRRESEWLSIRDSEIWKLTENRILSTLRLSYNHLPSHLKQCFAYCGLFEKDLIFSKYDIIQLWIAEGFVQSSGESKLMEEVAEEYFDELCSRSFFHKHEHSLKMHDLVVDLARSVAGAECSIITTSSTQGVPGRNRRSVFVCTDTVTSKKLICFENAKKLRTFFLSGDRFRMAEVSDQILNSTRLRVLNLGGSSIKSLPNSVGNLIHLRYLDLSDTLIEALPKSVTTLRNLQTLILFNCSHLKKLPSDMRKMISLRHLVINHYKLITKMPTRIGELSCLQTLPIFIVGKERGRRMEELQSLNLRGDLKIENLQNVLNSIDAAKANLKEKKNLIELFLSWKDVDDSTVGGNHEHVIESLQPHSNMRSLRIENYKGVKFPDWLMDLRVPKLVEVSLINCRRCNNVPPIWQLRFLKSLTIHDMPELVEWSSSQVVACVETLRIRKCPKLNGLPILPSLKNLELVEINEKLLSFATDCTSLVSLSIGGIPEMTLLPEGMLQNKTLLKIFGIADSPKLKSLSLDAAIEKLVINNCDEVESLMKGCHNLTSLKSLVIVDCNGLKSLPDEVFRCMTSLQNLLIDNCENLTSLGEGFQYLTALKIFMAIDCPELDSLPKSMQKLTALKCLLLCNLKKLSSLPEQVSTLTSLEELDIWDCPELSELPDLKNVTTLEYLEIKDCPSLERRCARGEGEDWHKIAHVPKVWINKENGGFDGPYVSQILRGSFTWVG